MPSKPLRGHLKTLDTIVVRRLEAGEREMTNASLSHELGMSDRNFRALVQKPEWQERRTQLGLTPQRLSGPEDGASVGGVAAQRSEGVISFYRV